MYLIINIICWSIQLSLAIIASIYWKRLPDTFRYLAFGCGFGIWLGTFTAFYFLLTAQPIEHCYLGRKFLYFWIYVGFLCYDYYQCVKFCAITLAGTWGKVVLYSLAMTRVVSYCYNIYYMDSVFSRTIRPGIGICFTSLPKFAVWQEHISAFLFETALLGYLVYFLYKNGNRGLHFKEFIRKYVDAEVQSFGIYYLAELTYMILYLNLGIPWLSILQACYITVPVSIFLTNIFLVYLPDVRPWKVVSKKSVMSGATLKTNVQVSKVSVKESVKLPQVR
ncbi:hypothetical protein BC833DRAFT_606003 [Globomyces pollinis-pini]|nr:hypothetical protein BC833DRAFT_606003 [Globomyces pollinis-pini]